MLFLLRQIRRKLMTENKISTYLLYAIGEILLVVIGILIAVSIDNWNQYRKDREEEQNVLIQLKEEYTSNLKQLDEKILMRNQMIDATYNIFRYVDEPQQAVRDSVLQNIWSIVRDPTFDPVQNDLFSTGKIRLITNDALRLRLSNWTTDVYQLQELELEWQKARTEIVLPFLIELGIHRDLSSLMWTGGYTPVEALDKSVLISKKIMPSKRQVSTEEILASHQLENIASMSTTWHQLANIQSMALRDRINSILDLIDDGLKPVPN